MCCTCIFGLFYLHYPFPFISSHYYPFHFPYLLYHFPHPPLLPRPSLPLPRNLSTNASNGCIDVSLLWSLTTAAGFLSKLVFHLSQSVEALHKNDVLRCAGNVVKFGLVYCACNAKRNQFRPHTGVGDVLQLVSLLLYSAFMTYVTACLVEKLSQNVCNISSRINNYSV